jgi:hypothetical protein
LNGRLGLQCFALKLFFFARKIVTNEIYEVIAMNSIYYSHSMRIYNTQQEELELTQIAELVPSRRIINPNGAIASIKEAYRLIDKSSGVVATEHQGHIGKGVYDEICYALSKHKLVAVLRSGESGCTTAFNGRLFRVYSEHQIEVLDVDWQVYYAKIYEGFVIPPLRKRLTVERIKAKKLHPGGILDDIADTTKEFLIGVGRIQVLSELFGERMK